MIPFLQIDDATAQFIEYEIGGVFVFLAGLAGFFWRLNQNFWKLDKKITKIQQFLKDKFKADFN